jgi:hypothetical protein
VKTILIVLGTIALAVALAGGGALLGFTWGRIGAGLGMMGYGLAGNGWGAMPCGNGWQGYGSNEGDTASGAGDVSSLTQAKTAVQGYVDRLGYTDLEVKEMMEFQDNYYAIVSEEDTGIGAMEILVDKPNGAIGPEPGPNMMWNAKYGMHGGSAMGMMGGYATGTMNLSPQEAEDIAQRWLDANLPGRTAGEADPFYGYYTLHFLKDGEVDGMLSVHGSTGDVWLHTWHGAFIQMTGEHS